MRRAWCRSRRARSWPGGPASATDPTRRSTGRGTWTPGRTPAAPRSPAGHRKCHRRTHPHGEVDQEELAPELRGPQVLGFPVRTHVVCRPATNAERPIVIGTKMKWYTVMMPNCHRARSRASTTVLSSQTFCRGSSGTWGAVRAESPHSGRRQARRRVDGRRDSAPRRVAELDRRTATPTGRRDNNGRGFSPSWTMVGTGRFATMSRSLAIASLSGRFCRRVPYHHDASAPPRATGPKGLPVIGSIVPRSTGVSRPVP